MILRRLALLDLSLLALMIVASRIALVIHEVGGHALPAWALGATQLSFSLSWFGGGWVHYGFPPTYRPSALGTFVISLGGIALNLMTGCAAWIAAYRFVRSRNLTYVFLLMLGAGSFGQALFYLANGFYFGVGDPVGFAPRTHDISAFQWIWILFVPPFALAAYIAARHYLLFLSRHASLDTARRRVGWSLATVGVACGLYGGLWKATWNATADFKLADIRLEHEIAKETARRMPTPDPTVQTPISRAPVVVVRPEEVADRVPAPVAPIAMIAAGVLAALWALRRGAPVASIEKLDAWSCAAAVIAAGACLLVIAFFD